MVISKDPQTSAPAPDSAPPKHINVPTPLSNMRKYCTLLQSHFHNENLSILLERKSKSNTETP